MKCGSCKGDHESVSEVKACYGVTEVANGRGGFVASRSHGGFDTSPGTKRHPADIARSEAAATRAGASREDLRQRRSDGAVRSIHNDVPAGHYATKSRTGNNDLDFWRVDRPTEGNWAGRIFVKRVIGGKPDHNVRAQERASALAAIAEDGPEAAAKLYGQEIGRCSRCNRHLTDETSREFGMGPECRSK
jgi:Family of unknown function (DUF6011)